MSIAKSLQSACAVIIMAATVSSLAAMAQTGTDATPATGSAPPAAQNARKPIRPLKRFRKNLRQRMGNRQHKQCNGNTNADGK